MDDITYRVIGMTCGHCKATIERELHRFPSVEAVRVDLARKLVTVRGRDLDDQRLRASLDEAGYLVKRRIRASV